MKFPIIDIAGYVRISDEPMGSKDKFWCEDAAGTRFLFKNSRPNTGEHWSEKLAVELGRRLGVPCARVELARCNGRLGCVVESFIARHSTSLHHGNELLQELDDSYPIAKIRGVSKHCVSTVLAVLENVRGPVEDLAHPALRCGADWFVGYLMLDALIVNTDRHHENWAVLQQPGDRRRLAPSYDHASSLGRELDDSSRQRRLGGSDARDTVAAYVQRARSALYITTGDKKPVHPLRAFEAAARLRPAAAALWIERLRAHDFAQLAVNLTESLPDAVLSDASRSFAIHVLAEAEKQLKAVKP